MQQYQVNPMQLVQMIKNGMNPQQLMISVLENQMTNTPLGANLLNLAKKGDGKQIEQIARNIYQQQGRNFDEDLNAFKRQLGL